MRVGAGAMTAADPNVRKRAKTGEVKSSCGEDVGTHQVILNDDGNAPVQSCERGAPAPPFTLPCVPCTQRDRKRE